MEEKQRQRSRSGSGVRTKAPRGRAGGQPLAGGTSDLILNAAEELFAIQGFHGVSIRDIARAANVNSALIHYYFGNKAALFETVFNRRAEVINQERLDLLNSYEKREGERVTVEGALAAFMNPLLSHLADGGPGWQRFFSILAQVNNTPDWGGALIGRYFDPVVQKLIGILRIALPDANPADLYCCYNFLSGALTLTLSQTGRVDRLSGGLCRSSDIAFIQPRLLEFAAAGFRSVTADRHAVRGFADGLQRSVRGR